MSWITRMCEQSTTEEEDLENIQDAIVDYLSVVDELTQESETRYVEVARDANFHVTCFTFLSKFINY